MQRKEHVEGEWNGSGKGDWDRGTGREGKGAKHWNGYWEGNMGYGGVGGCVTVDGMRRDWTNGKRLGVGERESGKGGRGDGAEVGHGTGKGDMNGTEKGNCAGTGKGNRKWVGAERGRGNRT